MRIHFICIAVLALALAHPGTTIAQTNDNAAKAPRDASKIFATTCGWCHNKGGREAGKGPQLMDTALSDAEIIHRIKRGKQGYMPSFDGTFSEEELQGLVRYIRALKPE